MSKTICQRMRNAVAVRVDSPFLTRHCETFRGRRGQDAVSGVLQAHKKSSGPGPHRGANADG